MADNNDAQYGGQNSPVHSTKTPMDSLESTLSTGSAAATASTAGQFQQADLPDGRRSNREAPKSRQNRKSRGKRDLGRKEFLNSDRNKRHQNDEFQERKRRKVGDDGKTKMSPFTAEEIAAEERRPKRKVAVMIGYAGTGYKGMQINDQEKTIEGDLFAAFVAAGAISKANADDPKKSSLARCARTDKGVHAAGNVISLKLIIEDENIVDKINANLPDQIRVWGVQRTNNAFSCYQACDSRWYEYLLPSYCLLPPHPDSYMWGKLIESAKEKGTYDEFKTNLEDVWGFWEDVDGKEIKPILESLDEDVRTGVLERLHNSEESLPTEVADGNKGDARGEENVAPVTEIKEETLQPAAAEGEDAVKAEEASKTEENSAKEATLTKRVPGPVDFALRDIKAAYLAAKRRYRVSPSRLLRLQAALDKYLGTRNFHNYTVQKHHSDPSAKRHIKSFNVNPSPIVIGDTEWLSLKVHGQSFMMHQIRKMVAMAVLVTRCAAPLERINESYGEARIAIPKAPGLGLLLERPMFGGYNQRAVNNLQRDPVDLGKYEEKIQEFKTLQIYRRIFDVEEEESSFHTFFHQVDNFRSDFFLWLTAGGIEVATIRSGKGDRTVRDLDAQLGDEDEDPEGGEG